MPPETDEAKKIISRIAIGTFIIGLLLAILGIVFIFLGVSADTEFSLFGNEFSSTSVGIGVIFIGVVLMIINTRRTLDSFDKIVSSGILPGIRAAGHLQISEIIVQQCEGDIACLIDIRVHNIGGSGVLINYVELKVEDIYIDYFLGFMELSKTYGIDISHLKKKGHSVKCPVAQVIAPGETDRFGVVLVATEMASTEVRVWEFKPALLTNFGKVYGKTIRVKLQASEKG